MLIFQNVATGLEQLWANKMRSVLTVIGIIIAVSSVITVVATIQGFARYVTDFLQGLGTNAMWVWPYRPPGEAGLFHYFRGIPEKLRYQIKSGHVSGRANRLGQQASLQAKSRPCIQPAAPLRQL